MTDSPWAIRRLLRQLGPVRHQLGRVGRHQRRIRDLLRLPAAPGLALAVLRAPGVTALWAWLWRGVWRGVGCHRQVRDGVLRTALTQQHQSSRY